MGVRQRSGAQQEDVGVGLASSLAAVGTPDRSASGSLLLAPSVT
jgi:hypothetical protein